MPKLPNNLLSTKEIVVFFILHVAVIEESTRHGHTGVAELFAILTWFLMLLVGAKIERYRASLEREVYADDDETQP